MKYDYSQEVKQYRDAANRLRERVNDIKRETEVKIGFLMDDAERLTILADHIELLCTKK